MFTIQKNPPTRDMPEIALPNFQSSFTKPDLIQVQWNWYDDFHRSQIDLNVLNHKALENRCLIASRNSTKELRVSLKRKVTGWDPTLDTQIIPRGNIGQMTFPPKLIEGLSSGTKCVKIQLFCSNRIAITSYSNGIAL